MMYITGVVSACSSFLKLPYCQSLPTTYVNVLAANFGFTWFNFGWISNLTFICRSKQRPPFFWSIPSRVPSDVPRTIIFVWHELRKIVLLRLKLYGNMNTSSNTRIFFLIVPFWLVQIKWVSVGKKTIISLKRETFDGCWNNVNQFSLLNSSAWQCMQPTNEMDKLVFLLSRIIGIRASALNA